VLDPLTVDKHAKAAAFDAFYDSTDAQDFQKRFAKINIPKEAKAALWDQKFGGEQKELKARGEAPASLQRTIGETAVNELPAIGATVGGVTMGIPGAAAGGMLGQAAKRALRYQMGEAPPAQAGEFARDVAGEGLKQGALEGAGRVVGAGVGLARKAALPLYKGTLSFAPLESLPARTEAAEQGLRMLRAPVSERAGLPKVDQFVKDMTAKVDAEIAKAQKAGVQIDTEKILAPVREQVAEYAKSLAPTAPTEAARNIERDIVLRLGGHEVNVAGPGGTVVKRLVPGPRFMEPMEAQEAKRATSRTLRKAYGEEKGPAVEALKSGERGAKEAIEAAVPGVKDPNWQEHVALTLKDSMERAVKAKPGFLKDWTPYILGSAAAATALGHPGVGEAGVVAALIREAMRNPAVMSRFAIALDRAGVVLPKIVEPAVKYGVRFGQPLTEPLPTSRFAQQQSPQ